MIKKTGIWLCGLSFIAALFVFIFSLPHVGFGLWPQSEFTITVLHALGGVCGLGVFLVGAGGRFYLVRRLVFHPFVLLPFAIAVLSLVLISFYDLPVRHLLGNTRTGEGVVLWLDWALLSAGALLLCRIPAWRRALIITAVCSFAVILGMRLSHQFFRFYFTPQFYSDFLAFHIIALPAILWPVFKDMAGSLKFYAGLYAVILFLMLLTENNVGIAYALIGVAFFIGLWALPLSDKTIKLRMGFFGTAAVPFLVVMLMIAILLMSGTQGYYPYMNSGAVATVVSRAHLLNIVTESLWHNPASLLTGYGWGTYTEQVTRNVPVEWVDFTREGGAQWDGLSTDHFHSHNMFVETLFSIGAVGTALLFLYILSFPLFCLRRYRFPAFLLAGGFMTLGSFWFIIPASIPFIILAGGMMAGFKPVFNEARSFGVVPALLILGVCLSFSGSYLMLQTARAHYAYEPLALEVSQIPEGCRTDYKDYGAGGIHISFLMLGKSRSLLYQQEQLEETAAGGKPLAEDKLNHIRTDILRFNHLFCQTQNYMNTYKPTARLRVARLIVRNEMLFAMAPYLTDEEIAYYRTGWKEELKTWLKQYPRRTDQAVPFLLWHFVQGRENEMTEIVNMISLNNAQDPVGLWFKGLLMTANPAMAEGGLFYMRRALDEGIERYMPVDAGLKAQLRAGQR